ncbi:MAG TPA: glucose 1-dehydrogenase [Myxococcota bacterium]|nr:glucose 1-dehydrogenase [Myxococcota bacterium]
MQELEGRAAIVTGAARGAGAVIARRLAARGARVVLGDVRHQAGEKVAAEIGAAASYVPHDVTREAEWQRIVEHTLSRHGRVDVLVNNAAVLHLGALERTDEATFRRVFEINTLGPFLGVRAVLEPMRRAGRGSIVNIGSIDGLSGANGLSAYCTSKWGLRGFTKAAAMELGRDGIRVNCVCPAGGNPEMYGPWMQQIVGFLEQTRAYLENRGIPGTAPLEVIADAVLFFASDASANCTGVDLPVDGGAHAGRFIPGFSTL